ncbi:hypothetical protein HMPREF9629_02092, partial [Peptoanaerobacter stomatis]
MKRKFGLFLSMLLLAISPYSFQSNNIITKNLNVLSSVYATSSSMLNMSHSVTSNSSIVVTADTPVRAGSDWTYGDFAWRDNFGTFLIGKVRGLSNRGVNKLATTGGNIDFPDKDLYGNDITVLENYDTIMYNDLISLKGVSEHSIYSVTLPANLETIGGNFFKNQNITQIDFPSTLKKIGFKAFEGNKIENLTIPESVNFIGPRAFRDNQISNLTLPSNTVKYNMEVFRGNKIINLNSSFNPDALASADDMYEDDKDDPYYGGDRLFMNNELKNVSFEGIPSNITEISTQMLMYNHLKSLELPKRFNAIGSQTFKENKGWYNDNKKVALYIKDNGQYYLNNDTIDDSNAQDYTINPVLVNFQIQDKDILPQEIKDKTELNIKRIRSNSDDKDITARITEDYENFKLGDKLELTSDVEGYKLSLLDDSNQITLDPNNTDIVQDTSYGDGYEVGYKKADIKVKYQALPVELKIELVKLVNGAEQAITSAPNVTVKVDGAEQTITQGTTLNAKYADEVEITPTNNTSYAVDKVE